jgi:hypothetical protein
MTMLSDPQQDAYAYFRAIGYDQGFAAYTVRLASDRHALAEPPETIEMQRRIRELRALLNDDRFGRYFSGAYAVLRAHGLSPDEVFAAIPYEGLPADFPKSFESSPIGQAAVAAYGFVTKPKRGRGRPKKSETDLNGAIFSDIDATQGELRD